MKKAWWIATFETYNSTHHVNYNQNEDAVAGLTSHQEADRKILRVVLMMGELDETMTTRKITR